MVHVAVCQKNVIDRDDLIGSLADIEADVQLRYGDNCLLTGDGIARDLQIVNCYAGQTMTWHAPVPKIE